MSLKLGAYASNSRLRVWLSHPMPAAIPLSNLLSSAFDDLMRRDGMDVLADYPSTLYSSRLKAEDDSVIVIRTSHAEAGSQLLLALVKLLGTSPIGSTLFVSANRRAHLLGHALLASCLPKHSLHREQLTPGELCRISATYRSLRDARVSLLIKKRKQEHTSFTRLVRESVRSTNPTLLVIDQPKRCFPRQPNGDKAWSDGIPPSIRAMAKSWRFQITVLCSDSQEPTSAAHAT